MTETYKIKLPDFEGPFDLLLFFIERDELDINDIPISKITDDFLSYIRQMELLNIDLASEFIVVAATLCRIKAKMLLPRKEVDEAGNEIDPREELVQRLLEYQRYKSILEQMREMEKGRAQRIERGNRSAELKKIAEKALVDVELESVTLFKLLRTFERLLQKYEDRTAKRIVHRIVQYPYTIKGQQDYIFAEVARKGRAQFQDVFGQLKNRVHAIVTFLALLELLNMERLYITGGEGMNSFWLSKVKGSSE
ncbi:MAG: segregation/condensation protein A [Bacteroidota bacterium]